MTGMKTVLMSSLSSICLSFTFPSLKENKFLSFFISCVAAFVLNRKKRKKVATTNCGRRSEKAGNDGKLQIIDLAIRQGRFQCCFPHKLSIVKSNFKSILVFVAVPPGIVFILKSTPPSRRDHLFIPITHNSHTYKRSIYRENIALLCHVL
jgi:hypothetical protein